MKQILSLLLLLISIFCLSAVSSFELGISPTNITLNGMAGENLCSYVNVKSDSATNILFKVKWDNNGSYEEVQFKSQNLSLNKSNIYTSICFYVNNTGKHSGTLFVVDSLQRTEIGIPVYLDLKKQVSLTGFSIAENVNFNLNGISYLGVLLFAMIIEAFLLSYL